MREESKGCLNVAMMSEYFGQAGRSAVHASCAGNVALRESEQRPVV